MDYSVCMSSTEEEIIRSEVNCGQHQHFYCDMSPDEEDLIVRLHNLLGDRWSLIAGRIPGRTAEEVERYWKIRTESYHGSYSSRKKEILKPVCSRLQPSIESTPGWLRLKSGYVKYHLLAKH